MAKKRYEKVLVKQKNGRKTMITKLVKTCPVCGKNMYIDHVKEGGVFTRSRKYYKCSESLCEHKEMEEGSQDTSIRMGTYDKSIGILQIPDENEFLT